MKLARSVVIAAVLSLTLVPLGGAVRVVHPGFVLHRVATGSGLLHFGVEALAREPGRGGLDLLRGFDLDAEVIERSGGAVPRPSGCSMRTSFRGGSAMAK
jgi:hypothetical protein